MKKNSIIVTLTVAAVLIWCGIVGAVAYHQITDINIAEQTEAITEAPTEPPTEAPTEPPYTGFKTEDGIRYYYIDGELQKNTVVGNDAEGYFYAGESGAVNIGYCNGVEIDGIEWIVIEGEAYRVITESDKCLYAAAQDVFECTDPLMSREEKLKACFDHIKEKYAEGELHDPAYPPTKRDWPIIYANDLFIDGVGDCFSFGAAYAYMARVIGYTEAFACNSTGHGWAEVEERTYDPEWTLHSNKYSYYAMRYDEECDVPYAKALNVGAEYKRVQIVIHADMTEKDPIE